MCRESGIIERAGLVAAVEQAADGIVITDTDGKIQYVNPAFTAMTGYTSEEAVGQHTRILKSGRQPAAFYEELWNTIRSGRVWHGELINRRKDGTFYTEEMRITPVRDCEWRNCQLHRDQARRDRAAGGRGSATVPRRDCGKFRGRHRRLHAGRHHPHLEPRRGESFWLLRRGRDREAHVHAGSARTADLPGRHFTEQVLQGNSVLQYESLSLRKDGRRIHVSVIGITPSETPPVKWWPSPSSCATSRSARRLSKPGLCWPRSWNLPTTRSMPWTLDGTIVSWNRGAEALFGYSSQEIIGKNAAILAPPGRRDEVRQCLEAIRKGGSISPFETVRQAKDGRQIDVLLSLSPIRNPAGEVVGASAIAHDIGKRVRAERKLRESEERFREVFEHAPFGMCVSGLDGRFLQVNAAFCRMLGYSEEELLAKTWSELTHPDDLESSQRRMEQLWREPGGCLEAEKRYIHRNGNVVWGRMRISLVRDCGGNPRILWSMWKTSPSASGRRRRCARVKSASASWPTVARR